MATNLGLGLTSPVASGGVAHKLDTTATYAAGTLLSVRTNGTAKFVVDYAGTITTGSIAASALTGTTLPAAITTSSLTTVGTLVAGAVPASLVTPGTFPSGAYVFQGGLSGITTLSLATTLIAGHTAAIEVGGGDGRIQAHATNANAQITVVRWDNGANGPLIAGAKSRGGTIGTVGIVSSADQLLNINAYGDDGVDLNTVGGRIRAVVASAPSANRMPTYWAFFTAAGTSDNDVSEKMRLTSAGDLALVSGAKIRPDGVIGTGNTFAFESSSDVFDFHAGDATNYRLRLNSAGISISNALNAVSPTAPNRTITMVVGGTTVYIHCKTTND